MAFIPSFRDYFFSLIEGEGHTTSYSFTSSQKKTFVKGDLKGLNLAFYETGSFDSQGIQDG